jgi:threonine dehydratase
MSSRLGNTLLLKREDQQRTSSFKMRGAFNKISNLTADALARGVVTASSGNHAQGVAYGAKVKGCRAVIVMPVSTPPIKVNAVRALGGEVVQHGASFQDSLEFALRMAEEEGLTFVHPYDDPDVIAGQGTIGMEILRQHAGPIDAVFVAIGGGGMISGVGAYLKAVSPQTKLIGVHAEGSDAMMRSVAAGERLLLDRVSLFADGVAVRQVGVETFRLAREVVDEYMVVGVDAMCAAMREVFAENRAIIEPSAALPVAAAKDYVAREGLTGRTLVAVLCGANMNFDRLGFVVERSYVGEHREALIGVTIPIEPGAVRRLIDVVAEHRFSEFSYRMGSSSVAHVFIGVYVDNPEDSAALRRSLRSADFEAMDLTDNELAKAHLRHFVGGRTANDDDQPLLRDELLFRIDFPESPGAFGVFLGALPTDWRITAFHYRNHGADHASVLIGFSVPHDTADAVRDYLRGTGFGVTEDTADPAYRLFLR